MERTLSQQRISLCQCGFVFISVSRTHEAAPDVNKFPTGYGICICMKSATINNLDKNQPLKEKDQAFSWILTIGPSLPFKT